MTESISVGWTTFILTYWFSAGWPPRLADASFPTPWGTENWLQTTPGLSWQSLCPLPGPSPVGTVMLLPPKVFKYSTEYHLLLLRHVDSGIVPGTPPGSTLTLSCTYVWLPAKVYRYSIKIYLLLFRHYNKACLFPGTPPGSTSSIVYLASNQSTKLFGWVGNIHRMLGKTLCYASYVEIYIIYSFHSENITIST